MCGLYYRSSSCMYYKIFLYIFTNVCLYIAFTFISTLGVGDVKGVIHHS